MPFLLQLSTLTPVWSLSLPTVIVALAAISTALAAAAFIYVRFFYVDFPSIDGLPEIPGAEPLAGHMYRLGEDHASMTEKWALQYNWPVFQIRMGQRRAIVLNSFESARAFMIQNQAATLDRPWFHTFHGVVSATSAATIGTSPWNDHTKKQRRIVGSLTTGPEIQRLGRMLDLETCAMVSSMYYDSNKGAAEIAPHMYKKRVSLNIMTMFCYGTRFASVTNPMMAQILEDASTIASFRSTYTIMTDFIPHLRYGKSGAKNTKAVEVRGRRDKWLAALLDAVRQKLVTTATGEKAPTNTGARLTVAELILTDSQQGITEMDVKTILGGLMSGGFETVYSTAIIAVGMLSTPDGQHIQQQAFDDIMSHYSTPEEAFAKCVSEEKSAYVAGLVKEALRFYPPLKLLPARQTYKSFEYGSATIPKGVLVYMNAQAINRGELLWQSVPTHIKRTKLTFCRQSYVRRGRRPVQTRALAAWKQGEACTAAIPLQLWRRCPRMHGC